MTIEDWLEDARIEDQVRDLTFLELDRYYFEVLKRTMECTYDTYVAAYRVWDHELIWHQRRAARLGYLIFGSPSQETITLPLRDFTLYVIPPFSSPRLPEIQQPGALWLQLEKTDAAFQDDLKRYVAALEIAADCAEEDELDYENRAADYLDRLYLWLDAHAPDAFSLTFGDQTATLGQWCDRFGIPSRGCIPTEDGSCLRDILNEVAGLCLSDHFGRQAPDYPRFPFFIPGSDRRRIAQETLRHLAGAPLTNGSQAVIDTLGLMDDGMIDPLASPYAVDILQRVDADRSQPIIRRAELIPEEAGRRYLAPDRFRLEAEWAMVLLASLLQAGEIALIVHGERYLADRLPELAALPMDDLLDFEAVERLPGWNRQALQTLCDHLDLPGKTAIDLARGAADPARKIRGAAADLKDRMAVARERIAGEMPFWGEPLLSTASIRQQQKGLAAATDSLEGLAPERQVPEPEAIREWLHDPADLERVAKGKAILVDAEGLHDAIHRICDLTGYLTAAEALLPTGHAWSQATLKARDILRREISDPLKRAMPGFVKDARNALAGRRDAFIDLYIAAHNAPERLSAPVSCRLLQRDDLRHSPLCPHCRFKPWEK